MLYLFLVRERYAPPAKKILHIYTRLVNFEYSLFNFMREGLDDIRRELKVYGLMPTSCIDDKNIKI